MGDRQLDNWKRIIKLVTGHYWESYVYGKDNMVRAANIHTEFFTSKQTPTTSDNSESTNIKKCGEIVQEFRQNFLIMNTFSTGGCHGQVNLSHYRASDLD